MGRKVHPMGFRIGVIRDWQAKWYGGKQFLEFLKEDLKLRRAIQDKYADAAISQVEIDRQANKILITIYTARPGVVIGRGGQRVDEMRQCLEEIVGGRVQLNIQEVRQPELDAFLVARSVADQIERRIAFRRAMKRAVYRTLEAGAKGIRITCSGRLGGTEIARREMRHQGQVPLHKLRADIDYGFTEARTPLGRIGVKVWIYRGDILPEVTVPKVAEPEVGKVSRPEPLREKVAAVAEKPAPEPVAAAEAVAAPPVVEAAPAPAAKAAVEEKPAAEATAEVASDDKPKKRTTKKKVEAAVEEKPSAKAAAEVASDDKPKKRTTKKKVEAAVEEKPSAKAAAEVASDDKPKTKATKKKTEEKAAPAELEEKDAATEES